MCRGCASRFATAAGTRSTPGPRCRVAACWRPARRCRSSRGWPRRRPRHATWWCGSSTAMTLASAVSEDELARILIAEDEDAIRGLIARALLQDGHDIMTANDGAEALDVLQRERGAFELLLTDIRMPM